MDRVGSLRITRVGEIGVRLMESSDLANACTCGLCLRELNEGTMAPTDTLVPERAAPLALSLKPDSSVFPHIPLTFCELLSLL